MKLVTSLKISGGLILGLAVATAGSVLWQTRAQQQTLEALDRQSRLQNLSQQLDIESDSLTDYARRYTIAGEKRFKDEYYKLIRETKLAEKALAEMQQLGIPDEDFALVEESKRLSDRLITTQEAAFAAVEANDLSLARSLVFGSAYDGQVEKIAAPINQFHQRVEERAAQEVTDAKETANLALLITDLLLAASGLTVLLVLFSLHRRISHLPRLAALATQIAGGDLRVQVPVTKEKDEVAQLSAAFNQMVSNLRELVLDLTGSAQQVMTTSRDLSSSSDQAASAAQGTAEAVNQVAGSASEQARSAEGVQRIMQEFQTTIEQIASGAERSASEIQTAAGLVSEMTGALSLMAGDVAQVATEATRAAQTAQNGAMLVQDTTRGMDRIRQAADATATRITELEQLSSQIGEITTVISDIANQTNLLALNAAIEAARAGEHGRGFAVVADEVRKLAERSSSSTKQIAGLIANIQAQTQEAVRAMDLATQEVHAGSQLAEQAAQSLEEIRGTVEEAAEQVRSVAGTAVRLQDDAQNVVRAFESLSAATEESTAAAEQMAASAAHVNDSVTSIADLAQGNAAASEEVSASVEELTASAEQVAVSAQELAKVSEELKHRVAQFKL